MGSGEHYLWRTGKKQLQHVNIMNLYTKSLHRIEELKIPGTFNTLIKQDVHSCECVCGFFLLHCEISLH